MLRSLDFSVYSLFRINIGSAELALVDNATSNVCLICQTDISLLACLHGRDCKSVASVCVNYGKL